MYKPLIWLAFPILLTAATLAAAQNQPPEIGDIPAPIIGNATGASQVVPYVYPDAFDLDLLVSDDLTTPTSLLKWTYETVGSTYLINGIRPISSATTDPAKVPDELTINRAPARGMGYLGVTTETGALSLARITIRNERMNPLGGPLTTRTTVGLTDIQPVTFWCADGNAASSQTVIFYTDNYAGGFNRLSMCPCSWTYENQEPFFNHSWPVSEEGFHGSVTTHTWPSSGTGLCLDVTKTGDNWGSVASPLGFLTLSPKTIYGIRLRMNCSQIAPGATPFWDLVLENNYDAASKRGLNLYGMDAFFLDNQGGANSVISTWHGADITLFFTPLSVRTPQMAGLFNNPAYSAHKDARLRFRVLDVDSAPALLNNQKFGAICLQSVQIESIPLTKLYEQAPCVQINAFQSNTTTSGSLPAPGNNTQVDGYFSPAVLFTSGTLTLAPAGAGTANELLTVTPAADTDGAGGPRPILRKPFDNMADEWPIPWLSSTLYEFTAQLSAPRATDEAHPWDVIWMGIDTPTNEVNCESYVTAVKGIASPKAAAPQTYTFLYNCQNETLAPSWPLHFLRWRLAFGNSTRVNFPNPEDATNTGAVRIHSLTVRKVLLPGM